MHESKHWCVSSSSSAECAAWSGNLCLCTGAVAVSTSPAGDAGQHCGDERGESLHEGEREREKDGEVESRERFEKQRVKKKRNDKQEYYILLQFTSTYSKM